MIRHRLYGLRGKAYVAAYKKILAEEGSEIAKAFLKLKKTCESLYPESTPDYEDKVLALTLGRLAIETRMPVKLLNDCLPDLVDCYPVGTWERLQERGVKARDIGVAWQ